MVIEFPGKSKEQKLQDDYERIIVGLLESLDEVNAELFEHEFAALEAILITAVCRGAIEQPEIH